MKANQFYQDWIEGRIRLDGRLWLRQYRDNSLCVLFQCPGMTGLVLSVWIDGFSCHLERGLFCAKNWSENEELAKVALKSGVFEDTGAFVPTGFVVAPIWKIKF